MDILPTPQRSENDYSRHRVSALESEIKDLIFTDSTSDLSEDSAFEDDLRLALDLSRQRFTLMRSLGFKVVSLLDACRDGLELAREVEDVSIEAEFLNEGCDLSRILFGAGSKIHQEWRTERDKKT